MFYNTYTSLSETKLCMFRSFPTNLYLQKWFLWTFCVLSHLFSCCEIRGKQRSDMILVTLKRV